MKFIFLTLMSLSFFGNSFSQRPSSKDSAYYIKLYKDVMSDKEYAFGSKSLFCSEDGKKGFILKVSWDNKKNKVSYGGLSVIAAGIGGCSEKDELIILFEDDTKINLKSWNDFNCKGNAYFDLYYKSFDDISNQKVKAIRYTNGRSFDSYTYKLKSNEQNYFIEAKNALEQQKFVTITSLD